MGTQVKGYTRSPMENVLNEQLTDLRKLPPAERSHVTDTLGSLAIVVLEHEQRSHHHRTAMKDDIGHLTTKQEEVLNLLHDMKVRSVAVPESLEIKNILSPETLTTVSSAVRFIKVSSL